MLSSFYVITTGPTHAPTVGLIHLMPRTLWEFGPSSLKPNDEGSASKQSSSNSRPLSRQPLRRDSKSWFRYFTAWSLAPIPCAFSRLCWSFAAMPDMISDSWQEDGAGCRSPCAQVCVRVAVCHLNAHWQCPHPQLWLLVVEVLAHLLSSCPCGADAAHTPWNWTWTLLLFRLLYSK